MVLDLTTDTAWTVIYSDLHFAIGLLMSFKNEIFIIREVISDFSL